MDFIVLHESTFMNRVALCSHCEHPNFFASNQRSGALLWLPAKKLTIDQSNGAKAKESEVMASNTKCVSRPMSCWRFARAAMKKLTSEICASPAAVRLTVCSAAGLVFMSGP